MWTSPKFLAKVTFLSNFHLPPFFNNLDLRVLKKNMVYCSGIPSTVTEDELTSESYFGKYGKITKVIVNPYPNKNYCSLYITYSHEFEAATAILVLLTNNIVMQ